MERGKEVAGEGDACLLQPMAQAYSQIHIDHLSHLPEFHAPPHCERSLALDCQSTMVLLCPKKIIPLAHLKFICVQIYLPMYRSLNY